MVFLQLFCYYFRYTFEIKCTSETAVATAAAPIAADPAVAAASGEGDKRITLSSTLDDSARRKPFFESGKDRGRDLCRLDLSCLAVNWLAPQMLASTTPGEGEAYRKHSGFGNQVLERFQCQCSSWTRSASLHFQAVVALRATSS